MVENTGAGMMIIKNYKNRLKFSILAVMYLASLYLLVSFSSAYASDYSKPETSLSFEQAAIAEFETASRFAVPAGFGSGFRPNFDFPDSFELEEYPWLQIDPKSNPQEYMAAVKAYILEGNVEVDWDVGNNAVRTWYHAPWLHFGDRGREPIHGLTQEKTAEPLELHAQQSDQAFNWAVNFFNAPGGYTIGKVWKDQSKPDTESVRFPVGTLTAKMLFSSATVDQVPYVDGSKVWMAQINRQGSEPVEMRLLQLDFGIRDSRADSHTGWVFGTFLYQSDEPGDSVYDRLIPVGLHWGNDPDRTESDFEQNKPLEEGWVNPRVAALVRHLPRKWLGLWGRMNGPVDNHKSACLACHARAMDIGELVDREPPFGADGSDAEATKHYYKNRKPDEAFFEGFRSLDYSLVLAAGIEHYRAWVRHHYPDQIDHIYSADDLNPANELGPATPRPKVTYDAIDNEFKSMFRRE